MVNLLIMDIGKWGHEWAENCRLITPLLQVALGLLLTKSYIYCE